MRINALSHDNISVKDFTQLTGSTLFKSQANCKIDDNFKCLHENVCDYVRKF